MICVNLAGVVTFLLLGAQPRAWWERDGARRSSRLWLIVWVAALVVVVIYVLYVS